MLKRQDNLFLESCMNDRSIIIVCVSRLIPIVLSHNHVHKYSGGTTTFINILSPHPYPIGNVGWSCTTIVRELITWCVNKGSMVMVSVNRSINKYYTNYVHCIFPHIYIEEMFTISFVPT